MLGLVIILPLELIFIKPPEQRKGNQGEVEENNKKKKKKKDVIEVVRGGNTNQHNRENSQVSIMRDNDEGESQREQQRYMEKYMEQEENQQKFNKDQQDDIHKQSNEQNILQSTHQKTKKQQILNQLQQINDYNTQLQQQKQLKLCKILCIPKIFASSVALFSLVFSQAYYAPFLANQLTDFDIPSRLHGTIFGIRTITFLMGSMISFVFVRFILGKTLTIFTFAILHVISLFLLGPSALFHLPNEFFLLCIGLALLGLSNGMVMTPLIPDQIIYLEEKKILKRNKASDVVGGFVQFSSGVANILSPIIASLMYEAVGFRWTSDFVMIMLMLNVVCYLVWGGVVSDCKERWRKRKERKVDDVETEREK